MAVVPKPLPDFRFLVEDEEEKKQKGLPDFSFLVPAKEEIEVGELLSGPSRADMAQRDWEPRKEEAREKRHSEDKQVLIESLNTDLPVSEIQESASDEVLDWAWRTLRDASVKNWDAEDEKDKREAMSDFSKSFSSVLKDSALRRRLWKKADESPFGDKMKFYRALHDSTKWAVEDDARIVPEGARHWMQLGEEGLPTTGKGSRAALRMGTEITERMPKPKKKGFRWTPKASDFHPAEYVRQTRELASVAGRDILEGLASLQVTPTGVRGTETPFGETIAAFEGEDPAEVQEKRPGFVTEAGGLAGSIGPEIGVSLLGQPWIAAWMRSARIPVTAEYLLGDKAYRASKEGQRMIKAISQSTNLAAAGGGLSLIEKGNLKEATEAGLTWAALPLLHKWASNKAGDTLTKLLSKRKKISDATKFEQALVAESAGMGAALAAIESPQMVAWLEADTAEEKDKILEGMLSRLGAFWFIGYGRTAKAEARGGLKIPRTPEKGRGLERFTKEAKKELQTEREINLLIEELKGSPESMKRLRDSLDNHWDAHEAVPRGLGIPTMVARMEAMKKGQSDKVQAAITKMQEEVRRFQVGERTVEPGVVDPVTGRPLLPKKLPAKEAIPTEAMEEIRAARQRKLQEQTEAFEVGEPTYEPPTPVEAGVRRKLYYGTTSLKVNPELKLDLNDMEGMGKGTGFQARGLGRYASQVRGKAEWYARGKKPEGSKDAKEGLLYEYEVDYGKDTILDHSKKGIENQPPVVQEAWKDFLGLLNKDPIANKAQLDLISKHGDSWGGATFYDIISGYFINQKRGPWESLPKAEKEHTSNELIYYGRSKASAFLLEKGVNGMLYRGSRGGINEVIFNTGLARVSKVFDSSGKEVWAAEKAPKTPEELPAELPPPPELPADIPPSKPPPPDVGDIRGRPHFPRSGRMLPRSFSDAVIKHYKETDQKERAAEFEENRDNIYEELPVTEASKFIRGVTDVELAEMTQQKGVGKSLWHWENVIDAERIRRWERKGDPESLAKADDLHAEKSPTSTGYGQWLQQLTLFNNSTGYIIKAVDKSLKDQYRPKLTGDQISELRHLIQKTKASNARFEEANDLYKEKPTKANFDKMVEMQWYATLRQYRQSQYTQNFLPERTWPEWATAQIQGGLLTPGSQVLNIGSVLLMKPVRAIARGVDSASDLLYAKTIGKGKDPLGYHVKIPNPIRGLARSFEGFAAATGVPKYTGRVIEALKEDRGLGGEAGDWLDIAGTRGRSAGLGLKPSPMARWSEKDWKGFQTMLDVAVQGAESSPYELKGVNLKPINSRAAKRQLQRLLFEDVIRYESKPVKFLGKHLFNVPGGMRKFNAAAKNFFEASFGIPSDMMFTGLYWGDVGFRKGAEFRIFGNWAEQKLSEMDLSPAERQKRVGMAMEDPRTLFTADEVAYGEQLAAQEVYQGNNYVTEKSGAFIEKLRKDWPLSHFATRLFLPYMKTPLNVAGEVLAYTPGGAMMNVASKKLQIWMEAKRKGGLDKVSKSSIDALKRATGQMAMAVGISQFANYLSDYGLVTPHLHPGEDPEKMRRFARKHVPPGNINLSGFGRSFPIYWKANQDRLFRRISAEEFEKEKIRARDEGKWREGDKVAALGRTSAGIIIGVNVDVNYRLERLDDDERSFLKTQLLGAQAELGMATHFMLAQDYTQTIGELADVMVNVAKGRPADAGRLGSKLFEAASTIFIPRTPSWIDMVGEENIPTFRGDDFENMTRNKLQARLDSVGLDFIKLGVHRKDLPKILDMRGKEVLRTPTGDKYILLGLVKTDSPMLWHFLGLGKVHKTSATGDIPIRDPAVAEMLRLSRKLKGRLEKPDTDVIPAWPSPIVSEKTAEGDDRLYYKMSPKLYERYQKMVGSFRFEGTPLEYVGQVREIVPADRLRGIDKYLEIISTNAENYYWAENRTDEWRARQIKKLLDYGKNSAQKVFINQNRQYLIPIPPRVGRKFD